MGVAGQHITGQFLNIVARASLKKNLEHSFEQAKVEIADLLIAPIALANAVLTENEMRSGCALVDFGADTTTISVYKNNILRYLSVLPLVATPLPVTSRPCKWKSRMPKAETAIRQRPLRRRGRERDTRRMCTGRRTRH